MDTWNPDQYAKFLREREQPFTDLLALIDPVPGMRVVDLGCGTGNLTCRLHEVLRATATIGIDRSDRMLEAARRDAAGPGLSYEGGTIESFDGQAEWDLIFSNAAFHWVEDHDALVRRLHTALKPGGQLAFQIPAMHHATSHALPDVLAQESPFREAFGGWTRPQPVLEPDDYARLLFRVGFSEPKVRLIIYPHVLESREAVVEWMKGTLLTEYERRLTPEQYGRFVAAFRERLLPQLDADRPFLFPFRRMLCWGRKAAPA